MNLGQFLKGSALSGKKADRDLAAALDEGDPGRETILDEAFGGRWAALRQGAASFSLDDLGTAVRALGARGLTLDAGKIPAAHGTPLGQSAFYDALADGRADAASMALQIESIRADAKRSKGFLSFNFGIFADRDPAAKIVATVTGFAAYCRRNGLRYDEGAQRLVVGEKPRTALDKIAEMRFLLAAVGGGALGLAGVNVAQHLPLLEYAPKAFFAAMPYLAVPFVGLSLFTAFSEKNFKDEWKTFARFVATMSSGFAIGAGVVAAMGGVLPHFDPMAFQAAASALPGGSGEAAAGFNPSEYILHVMGAFALFSCFYKMAKKDIAHRAHPPAPGTMKKDTGKKGVLARLYNAASGLAVNAYTAGPIVAAGRAAQKAHHAVDKAFIGFMNFVGLPAIFTMMSQTLSDGGLAKIGSYAGYYEAVFTAMGLCAAALAGTSWLYGKRTGKDARAIAAAVSTAFSTSSGNATMPVTKESLRQMGVSERTRESVVPLSANFNMLGTSLYLGMTALAANAMFGHTMDLASQLQIMAIVVLHGYGAPGIPSSNLSLLSNVLGITGLSPGAIEKVYEMVVPGDRLLDMCQTALNVWGDMIVAIGADGRYKIDRARNIAKIREERTQIAAAIPPQPAHTPGEPGCT